MAKEEEVKKTDVTEKDIREELFKQIAEVQKLTEQLNKDASIIDNYKKVNATLSERLEEANLYNVYKRLDYAFKVLELESSFPFEFVEANKEVIMKLMSSKEEEEEKKD